MQILLVLKPEKPLMIPFNYNYQLQSALYAILKVAGESDFWHNNGFGSYAKTYKGFCFGKLDGKYIIDMNNKKLLFEDEITLEVRSPSFDFIDSFQRALEKHPFITLFDTRLTVVVGSLLNRHLNSGTVKLEAITPVLIHETYLDGHTYFFSPNEEDFFARICYNAAEKYKAITGKQAEDIFLHPSGTFKKTVTMYKSTRLTGYTGSFELRTSLKMAEFLYNTGLGERNSQGFGFLHAYDGQ